MFCFFLVTSEYLGQLNDITSYLLYVGVRQDFDEGFVNGYLLSTLLFRLLQPCTISFVTLQVLIYA